MVILNIEGIEVEVSTETIKRQIIERLSKPQEFVHNGVTQSGVQGQTPVAEACTKVLKLQKSIEYYRSQSTYETAEHHVNVALFKVHSLIIFDDRTTKTPSIKKMLQEAGVYIRYTGKALKNAKGVMEYEMNPKEVLDIVHAISKVKRSSQIELLIAKGLELKSAYDVFMAKLEYLTSLETKAQETEQELKKVQKWIDAELEAIKVTKATTSSSEEIIKEPKQYINHYSLILNKVESVLIPNKGELQATHFTEWNALIGSVTGEPINLPSEAVKKAPKIAHEPKTTNIADTKEPKRLFSRSFCKVVRRKVLTGWCWSPEYDKATRTFNRQLDLGLTVREKKLPFHIGSTPPAKPLKDWKNALLPLIFEEEQKTAAKLQQYNRLVGA